MWIDGPGVEIANRQDRLELDGGRLRSAVEVVLGRSGFQSAEISLVVVADPEMQELNRRFLQHDYPTDVLSFPLEQEGTFLAGEIILSADTAIRESRKHGLSPEDELLLYAVHGMLHLVGYRDKTKSEKRAMRAQEQEVMGLLGVKIPQQLPVE